MVKIYPHLVNRFLIPCADMITGTSISKKFNFLIKSDYWDPGMLAAYKEKQLKKMIEHIYYHVPYYKKEFKRLKITPSDIKRIDDLNKLPIVDKNIIKNNFNEFIPTNINIKKTRQVATGGSTGIPMKYYVSWDSYSWSKAALYRMYSRADHLMGQRTLTLAGPSLSSTDKMNYKKKILYTFIERVKKISSFDMSKNNLMDYFNIMKKYRPDALRGYANALYVFAQFIKDNQLDPPRVKNIFSAAEKLNSDRRELIEEVFNVTVYDAYGAGDGSVYAHECERHTGFHLDEELNVTEIIDNKGFSINNGTGEIISTSLVNLDFPFIRYRVGDRATITDKKCSCGRSSRVLKSVLGRNHEFIKALDGTIVHGEFFSHIFRENLPEINQFSVHQKDLNNIIIKIVGSNYNEEQLRIIKSIIINKLGLVDITIENVSKIKFSSSGKWTSITSDIIDS